MAAAGIEHPGFASAVTGVLCGSPAMKYSAAFSMTNWSGPPMRPFAAGGVRRPSSTLCGTLNQAIIGTHLGLTLNCDAAPVSAARRIQRVGSWRHRVRR
jgi:hypothetical protein